MTRNWPSFRTGDAEFLERRRKLRDRYHGALLGLAAGDALGTTLEFKTPGTFKPLSDMVGGGPFNLQPGQWTDDPCGRARMPRRLLRSLENQVGEEGSHRRIWDRFHNGEVIFIIRRKCNTDRSSPSIPLRKCTTLNFVCFCLCLLIDRVGPPVGDCFSNWDARKGVRFWTVG
jgi:hypothetical protein